MIFFSVLFLRMDQSHSSQNFLNGQWPDLLSYYRLPFITPTMQNTAIQAHIQPVHHRRHRNIIAISTSYKLTVTDTVQSSLLVMTDHVSPSPSSDAIDVPTINPTAADKAKKEGSDNGDGSCDPKQPMEVFDAHTNFGNNEEEEVKEVE